MTNANSTEATLDETTPRGVAKERLAARFATAGIENPTREAALVLQRAAGVSAGELVSAPEVALGASADRTECFARRRAAGEPLSRIEGKRAFWRHDFSISPDVLDPRADTETLVEAALLAMAERAGEPLRLLDLGVGSGAILCTLLSEWPRATGIGMDVSAAAAAVACSNAQLLGLSERANICVGHWGEGLADSFDVVVSNPPYVASDQITRLSREVRDFDPRLALDGGPDGLDAYRALAPAIVRLLAPRGRFFLEMGAGQAQDIAMILRCAGLEVSGFRKDLAGVERVAEGRL